jgi:DNA-binding XRE family transcriptional regulator
MAEPNAALRAVRMGMILSQDDFARALRAAGLIGASKRTVQRWEAGDTIDLRPRSVRALEQVTGLPIAALGFDSPVHGARVSTDGEGGHDVHAEPIYVSAGGPRAGQRGNYSGVWLSRYEYHSSSRGQTFKSQHYVVVIQHGDRLTVTSLAGSASQLRVDLTVDGNVLTGTWTERTALDGYYRGARYHGAIQMLAEPTGRRFAGKWVGFGKDMDVNTGPWELIFQDSSTSKATLERYARPPE